jgi:hypothetical protein
MKAIVTASAVRMMHFRGDGGLNKAMADERRPEPVDGPSSDAIKGEESTDPRPTSAEPEKRSPEEVETDLVIEDRFEATDN